MTIPSPGSGARRAGSGEAIVLDEVSLRYFTPQGETLALDRVSLRVEPGEFVSIVGPSGCGKSTLLSIIAGILPASSGVVTMGAQPIRQPSPRIGYMLQQDYLFEWRNILDNALLGAEIQGLDRGPARVRAIELLGKYGLGDFLDHYPRELSGGMRQRVALARTLVTQPDVVLLDEPFSALDSQTRLALADEVVAILREEGKSVILVTHDLGEAITMTDRVVVLSRRPGRVKAEHTFTFPSHPEPHPAPFVVRTLPEYNGYFATLWRELEIHIRAGNHAAPVEVHG